MRESSSVLHENNKQIIYEYDGLNRLVRIDYLDTEDTVYTYGGADDTHGAAGKILSVTDASGTLEYEYGKLGEVTKETRTLATHLNGNNPTETAVMEYRSDYLGRMQWIVYPDGEKITYGYDRGGQVISVTGKNYGYEFDYVTNILYDEYGQRTRIDYGNGTFTEYNYDPARRWLDTIKTQNKWGQSYQNINYSFDAVGNVLGYENDCLDSVTGNYKTKQTYSYDNLYQLIKVDGETTYNPYKSSSPEFVSNYSQLFEFDTDGLGNMTSKVSSETVTPQKSIGDNLNYSFNYVYDENYAHRLINAGDRYYKYDANGNIICEQDGSFESNGEDTAYHKINHEAEDVYSTDYGWGLFKDEDAGDMHRKTRYRRTYTWNECNQLVSSVDANYNTAYVYGQDGQRSNKYTQNSETLYFNKMWALHTDSGNNVYGGQTAKNIYLGETRIVTKLNSGSAPTYQEEYYKQYYYHSDHLGSASLISDYKGDEYQRIEYTPYGETWVEKTSNTGLEYLPYKFTAKELDEETGLYYYGVRYLDPKYSMWISCDPALGEYIPMAPTSEEARSHNQNLPGLGGVFNTVNLNLYHYAANNPIKYTDPDGKYIIFKMKENGQYGLCSYLNVKHGISHYMLKTVLCFIPFGSIIMYAERIGNIDSTQNFKKLYDSDEGFKVISFSNAVDVAGFTKIAKNSEVFGEFCFFLSIYGVVVVNQEMYEDAKVDWFMSNQITNLFSGVLSDKDAVHLGKYLAEGGKYYFDNYDDFQKKGISPSEWGKKIRDATNGILGNPKFIGEPQKEYYNELANF